MIVVYTMKSSFNFDNDPCGYVTRIYDREIGLTSFPLYQDKIALNYYERPD